MLQGDLKVQQLGSSARIYHAGEFIAESVDRWHVAETVGEVPVKLLVIDQLPPGRKATVLTSTPGGVDRGPDNFAFDRRSSGLWALARIGGWRFFPAPGRRPPSTLGLRFTPTSASSINAVEGFFASLLTGAGGAVVFHSLVDALQCAVNRFVVAVSAEPRLSHWAKDPDTIIATVRSGRQVLDYSG
ncbi:hypothetical protein [Methylocella silvestris]|uniref:hypothetical protein n=1 Tax=Methylocella silvestris TaxID=199596 RepID=UPI0001725DC9|nr:hypothetical protein [Methylocella silvestris]